MMVSGTQNLHWIKSRLEDTPIWRRFRRNVSISVQGSVLSLAVKLGQTVLLTRVLKIDHYGRVLLVLNFFVFLDSFFGLRVSDVMFRFFPLLKEKGETRALKGLLLLCLGICLASGLFIYGAVVILSPWLADRFYPSLNLSSLLRIYGCTILFSSFSGVYEPVLRVHDRFTAIVAPQVLGSLVTLALLCLYFAMRSGVAASPNGAYNVEIVVAAFALGALIQSVFPFIKALRLVRPVLSGASVNEAMRALAGYRRAITTCLMNSNLSGYLKFAISPGDVFLLGLFSTPTQLAWYGLAKQLTAPLAFLQTNIQTAVTPEISSLVAERKFEQLKWLLARYLTRILTVGSFLLVIVILLGRFLILKTMPADYSAALPVFYLLAVAAWLMLLFLMFRPLALNLDLLHWHNLVLLASSALVILFIMTGKLTAMTMAYIQLIEVLILRSLFGVIIRARLKRLTLEK
jgi:O-antigen/teichoic acid export membrane protein